ncbi:MAG: type IV toxin-antitoxin system AbiEi family antitoxin domain-containing protein [Halobacteriota archaeon]
MVTNNEKIRKGLSSRESFLLSKLSSRGKRIIEIKDIENALNTNYKNAKKTASELERKGWLDRLSRGKYLIIPLEAGERSYYTEHEFLIASRLVSPYYIGFLSALNFHGMTEQTPMTVFIATTKRVRNRTVHGISYSFVTLKKSRFFGYREYAVTNKAINISDPEKTIIDCMNHLEYSGGIEEVVKGLKNPLNLEKLVDYAIRMGNGAAIKRLHYLLHTLEYPIPEGLERHLKDNYSRSYSLLDPTRPDKGNYNSTWMLRLNIPEKDLLGDVY